MNDDTDTPTADAGRGGHDPFSPDAAVQPQTVESQGQLDRAYGEFPEARYRAAGATDDQINGLRATWAAYDDAERGAEGRRLAAMSNEAVADEVGGLGTVDNPFGKNVDDITAAVGDDPVKAQAALDIENASKKPRSTLVEHLTAVITGPGPDDVPSPTDDTGGAGDTPT